MTDHICDDRCAHTIAIDGPIIYGVLAEVAAERKRQDAKWGEQNHPLIDPVLWGRWPTRVAEEYEIPTASRAQFLCEEAARKGEVTWAHILVEEVAEFVGGSPQSMRAELIQVAAVAVAAVEAIDRRAAKS